MKRILIVDDEVRLLESISAGLKGFEDQFTVATASNGKEAVALLEQETFDLLITDLRMPEMDGFELLAWVSSNHPYLPSIVMTAFATPELEEQVNTAGTSQILEKPIEFNKLADTIIETLEHQDTKEGSIAGFSLVNFLQLLGMEQKTCLLKIESENMAGFIYLSQGEVVAAICGDISGEAALFKLLGCENVRITFKRLPKKRVVKMISKPLMSLLLEGMQRIDEEKDQAEKNTIKEDSPVSETIENTNTDNNKSSEQHDIMHHQQKGDDKMGKLEDALAKMTDIEGFMAAGIFTPNGEMAAEMNVSGVKLNEIGSIANDVLLKAQKATDVMNVGRGQVVHIEAPKSHVIARCLNEADNFDENQTGKAHIHMVMLLDKDANLAMGKIKLESVIHEVAASFR